jgi:hypothetical protein
MKVKALVFSSEGKDPLSALLDVLIKDIMECAEKTIEDGDPWEPTVVIVGENEAASVPLPFRNEREKRAMFQAMNETLKEHKPQAAIFTCESWLVEKSVAFGESSDLGCAPSEHPDKKECVILLAEYDFGCRMVIRDIDRSGPTPKLRAATGIQQGNATAAIFKGVFEHATGTKEIH